MARSANGCNVTTWKRGHGWRTASMWRRAGKRRWRRCSAMPCKPSAWRAWVASGARGAVLRGQVAGAVPEGLLAGVHTADDLGAALSLRGRLAPGQSVVSREGIWLGPDWLKVAREQDQEAGVLERRREL